METSRRWPLRLQQLSLLLIALTLILPSQALYVYLDGASANPKCFYEELPKDTLVSGHYSALQHDAQSNSYIQNPQMSITVTVDEVFDNDHRVVNTKGSDTGKFTFSAADAGDHRICFTPAGHTSGGWLSSGQGQGQIKLSVDLAIGETSAIESTDKGKLSEIAQKVRDLNGRLQDIRREQVFQRVCRMFADWRVYESVDANLNVKEREAEFRDQSETTNARVVRWTLLQLVVLGVTCAWQLSHLRAFFIKQKLT